MEKIPDRPVEEAEHQEESAPLLTDLLTPDEDSEKQAPAVEPATPRRRYHNGFYLIACFTQSAVLFRAVCEQTKCTTCTELTLIVLMGLNFIAMGILHYIGP